MDVGAAAAVAKLESALGIRATYFLMLRSPVYNLLSRANHRLVNRIVELGHWIGLHYDQGFDPEPSVAPAESVGREAQILQKMFGVPIGVVSFHQPGAEILRNDVRLPGLVNVYDREDMRDFAYVSDSNMTWRSLSAYEIFRTGAHRRLHLLIHPLWWVAGRPGLHDVGGLRQCTPRKLAPLAGADARDRAGVRP